jgi:uncharacterized coiled-coil protein SlyX
MSSKIQRYSFDESKGAMVGDDNGEWCHASHIAAPVVERQPFFYGVMQPDGKPHYSELCVSGEASDLESEAESMSEEGNGEYRVVALYTAPPELSELQATIERLRAELGECKGEYDRAVNKVDALRDQLEQAQADLVRMTEGRDGLRSTLDEANKIIAWQRTELDQLKKNAGHSALRREAFDKLTQAGKSAGPTSGDVYAYDSEEPAKGSDA